MLAILKNRTYRHLFLAQVIALVGTGLGGAAVGPLAMWLIPLVWAWIKPILHTWTA